MFRVYQRMPVFAAGYVDVRHEGSLLVRSLTPLGAACLRAQRLGYVWDTATRAVDVAATAAYWRECLGPTTPRRDLERVARFDEPELRPLARDALYLFLQR